jgi:site-specific DNA-cytosine methylase
MAGLLKVRKGQMTKTKKGPHTPPPPVVTEINRLAETWKKRLGFWKPGSSKKTFALGSDCAGYGSELLALRLLGLQARVKLLMLCEASPSKRALHKVMVDQCGFDDSECKVFDDIFRRRNDDEETPVVDLYVTGYPCPAFSRIGKRQGCGEKHGVITLQGLHYVASKRPRALLLEQVSALVDKTHASPSVAISIKDFAALGVRSCVFQVKYQAHGYSAKAVSGCTPWPFAESLYGTS